MLKFYSVRVNLFFVYEQTLSIPVFDTVWKYAKIGNVLGGGVIFFLKPPTSILGDEGPLVVIQGVMSAETYINTVYITPGMLLWQAYVTFCEVQVNLFWKT